MKIPSDFNPVLHESFESAIVHKRFYDECMCDSTDPDDFYPHNKKKCRYCVSQHTLKVRKGLVKPKYKRAK